MLVRSLGSGSSGNSFFIQSGNTRILIDAGVPARRIQSELEAIGVGVGGLAGILLTHEHTDHASGAARVAARLRAPILANAPTFEALGIARGQGQVLPTGAILALPDLEVESFGLPHDGVQTVGYAVRSEDAVVVLATDLGHLPDGVRPYLREADLVILESNHDVDMLLRGPYPEFLKDRILGGLGHLSNDQAAGAFLGCVSGRPQWLWLAHLSEVNNDPAVARRTMAARLRRAGVDSVTLEVLPRRSLGPLWDSDQGSQVRLF